jgi:D-glycero-D-manno-heptose 1,7-bisphosphate phosphatase
MPKISNSNHFFLLDRDGVLNKNVGYISKFAQIIPTSLGRVLAMEFRKRHIKVAIITRRLTEILGFEDFQKIPIYLCPHLPLDRGGNYRNEFIQDCDCRKPKPGMIHQAISQLGLNTTDTTFIGDSWVDVEAASNAGIRVLHVHVENNLPCEIKPYLLCLEYDLLVEILEIDGIDPVLKMLETI